MREPSKLKWSTDMDDNLNIYAPSKPKWQTDMDNNLK
eukprot:gene31375-6534_t